ncbi:MAG TPA: DUF488 domain-containing protein [Methyloceanibacter sp.]
MQSIIYTIGYEGTELRTFIHELRRSGVRLLLDIRAVPISHKKGFSKNQLAAQLADAGIAYRHLGGLGTPKAGRDAARGGDEEEFQRIFRAHLEEPEALLDLGEAIALATSQPTCLLCFERDPNHCHRLIVAERMVRESPFVVEHLFPPEA